MSRIANESAGFIHEKIQVSIDTAVILGSGLDNFPAFFNVVDQIDYDCIPHFIKPKIEGHQGKLILCERERSPFLVAAGRNHYYEGYPMQKIVHTVDTFAALGVRNLIVTNAAGGVNPHYTRGDIMVMKDHINLIPNPLIGREENSRFVDMGEAYDKHMIKYVLEHVKAEKLHQGVYVGVTGPSYETPAEYNYLRNIGGDAVGMSTTPEVIVAKYNKMKCFGMSVITNTCKDVGLDTTSHEEVQRIAKQTTRDVAEIVNLILQSEIEGT